MRQTYSAPPSIAVMTEGRWIGEEARARHEAAGLHCIPGRAMSESHKDLNITEGEWVAFCKDFNDTMAKFNVPEAERNELFAIVESTKGDIVKG